MNDTELEYFKDVVLFFQEVQWLYNEPVTKILSSDTLNSFPADWLEALKHLSTDDLNGFVVRKKAQLHWPISLINFVTKCLTFNKLPTPTASLSGSQLPKEFMKKLSPKKQHEIFHLAKLVHNQCLSENISLIIDLGAGLGYICQLLNHLYKYKVLGLESNAQNVEAAKHRQNTLFPSSLTTVKYVCTNIREDSFSDVTNITKQEFGDVRNICLIGLHACGDLSVHMSKLFLEMKEAKLLILVSCCYHKLSLKCINDKTENSCEKEYFNYFPLSMTLKNTINSLNVDIGKFLRRPFMRLACQETSDRWISMSEKAHNDHAFHVLARAVLELYADKNNFNLKKLSQKATRKSQCEDFTSYLNDCTKRYVLEKTEIYNEELVNSTIPWIEQIKCEIFSLWKSNENKRHEVELYTALQLLLQNSAESLIIWDRLCFLEENCCQVNVISTMDRSLSPRCYAMVSTKKMMTG